MTLTVIDGDFPRTTIAEQNLTFPRHRMPADRNNARRYDARQQGPNQQNPGGILYHGALDSLVPADARRASLQ